MFDIEKLEITNDIDNKIEVNGNEKSKSVKGKNWKIAKFNILVKPDYYDFSFESINTEIINRSSIFTAKV